jgi:hypothetical protein
VFPGAANGGQFEHENVKQRTKQIISIHSGFNYHHWSEQPTFEHTKSVRLEVGKVTFLMEAQYLSRNQR